MTPFLLLVLVALGLSSLGPSAPPMAAAAQAPRPDPERLVPEVRAGFDGLGKAGRWLPVQVTLANDGPSFSGEVRLVSLPTDGGPRAAYARAVDLPTRSRKLVGLAAPAPMAPRDLRIELASEGREVASRDVPVRLLGPNDFLVGVLAGDDLPTAGLGSLRRGGGQVSVARLAPGDVPTDPTALQALDALVVRNAPGSRLTEPQRAALRAWVEDGGQLVVAGGPGWRGTVEGLAQLLPLEGLATREVEHLRALGRYAAAPPPDGRVLLTGGTPVAGARVLLAQDGVPLLAERWLGQGRVTFLAADPSLEPFRSWPEAEAVWQRVLVGGRAPLPSFEARVGPAPEPPIRAALAQLMDLGLPGAGWLALFLLVYVLAVGPIQYILLRRIDRREWAWAGFPLLALAFTGILYLGGSHLRGPGLRLGAVSIVRSAAGAETSEVDTYVGLVAPTRGAYDLRFVDGPAVRMLRGGVGSGAGLAPDRALIFAELGGPTRLPEARLEGWTLQAFHTRALGPAMTPVRAELRATLGGLEGLVTNGGPDRLEDALVLAAGETLTLGNIGPGESRPVSLALPSTRVANVGGQASAVGPLSPVEAARQTLSTTLLNRVGDGDAHGGALLLAWTGATPPRLTADGATVGGSATRLLQQALPLDHGDPTLVIPPGLLSRTVLDGVPLTRGRAPGLGVRGPIVFQYDLPPEVGLGRLDRLTVHRGLGGGLGSPAGSAAPPAPPRTASGVSPPSAPPVAGPATAATIRLSLFRWADRAWVDVPLGASGVADVPYGEAFIDGGAIRVRVEPVGAEALLQQLDLSLEGAPR